MKGEYPTPHYQSLQAYTFARIFTDFQGLIRVYGIIINFTGFPASSLWLVFSLFLWKNKPSSHNADHGVESELSHGHCKFSWNDGTKYGK